MKFHLFSATNLVEDLAHERVSQRDRAYYMLAGFFFSIVLGYSTLTFSNAGRTWLGLYEFLLLVVTTVLGFERCYTASNGDENRSFIPDFVCLSLPIGITTSLVAWGIYWGGWRIYQYLILTMSFESQQAAKVLVWINNEIPFFTVLLVIVLSNVIFYFRIAKHLIRIRTLQQSFIQSKSSIGT